jgi:hypothetical protein
MAVNDHRREEPEPPYPDLSRPEERHERSDVNVWGVGKFAIGLALLCIFALMFLYGLFRYFQSRENALQPPREGVNLDARRLPPEPRLQSSPILDLKQMRAAEDQILGTYGWIDQANGIVRLPIGRAMELVGQRGLPARATGETQPPPSNVSKPSESGLGPVMTAPGGPLARELEQTSPQQ